MLKMGFDEYAVDEEPSQNVDYLSNEWKFEDIWETRRFVRRQERDSRRRTRLENALWRSWAKINHQLSTISAASLNWEKDSDVTWLYGPWKSQIRSPNFSPRNYRSNLRPVPPASAFKTRISNKLSLHPLYSSMGPRRRQQYAEPYTAKASRQLATEYRAVCAFRWAVKARAALQYMINLSQKMDNTSFPSSNRQNRVRFNEEVQQCVVKETSLATEPCSDTDIDRLWVDRTPPIVEQFPSMTCATAKMLGFNKSIAPLPPTTLKSSGEIAKITWSATTDYLAEL